MATKDNAYPGEPLRAELARVVGLQPEEQERGKLRTLLYKMRINFPEGASADQLAKLVIDASSGRESVSGG